MKDYRSDLHIHTCLSPCADRDMSPGNIVKEAKRKGLHIIGICDHNSAENLRVVKRSAEKEGIKVIGGIEVTSREEIHILALFEKEESLFSLQEIIYESLIDMDDQRLYGDQWVVNEIGQFICFNRKVLLGSTDISCRQIVDLTHSLNGLAIAPHVDREAFSIIGTLGFIPEDLKFDALEMMNPSRRKELPVSDDFSIITSSDAHSILEVGKRHTNFYMNEANVEEIRKSLHGENGRGVRM